MALEIERKFLLLNDHWRDEAGEGVWFRQGYLNSARGRSSVRVRIEAGHANLNIKSATIGNVRHEYEYEIPLQDASEMLANLCDGPLIEKRRFHIPRDGVVWEIDEFYGDNEGLVVAEVELATVTQVIDLPEWIGREVTEDARYYNACLVNKPFKTW